MLVGRSAARLVEKSNKMVMSEKICRLLLFMMGEGEVGGSLDTNNKYQLMVVHFVICTPSVQSTVQSTHHIATLGFVLICLNDRDKSNPGLYRVKER